MTVNDQSFRTEACILWPFVYLHAQNTHTYTRARTHTYTHVSLLKMHIYILLSSMARDILCC